MTTDQERFDNTQRYFVVPLLSDGEIQADIDRYFLHLRTQQEMTRILLMDPNPLPPIVLDWSKCHPANDWRRNKRIIRKTLDAVKRLNRGRPR